MDIDEFYTRKGILVVPTELTKGADKVAVLRLILSHMTVFRVDPAPMTFDELNYIGWSEHFDPVEEGEVLPTYLAQVQVEDVDGKQSMKFDGMIRQYEEPDIKAMKDEINRICSERLKERYGIELPA